MVHQELLKLKLLQSEVINEISSAQSVAHTLARLNLSGAAARRFNGVIRKLMEQSTLVVTQRTQLEETLPKYGFELNYILHFKIYLYQFIEQYLINQRSLF